MTCTCGEWEEFGYPCKGLCAVYRQFKNATLKDVWKYVDKVYFHEQLQELFKYNITPVIVHGLKPDTNEPPPVSEIAAIGRPKNPQIRERSKPNPSKEMKCSICGETKHNKRTCDRRKKKLVKNEILYSYICSPIQGEGNIFITINIIYNNYFHIKKISLP
jgi:hypothetical protein